MKRAEPIGAHLVGSVPLASAEEVFRTVAGSLADRVRRIPDGETGPRADWIVWQYPVLSSRPQFEVGPPGPDHYRPLPRLQLKPGTPASELTFDSLGYAEAARSSYAVFARLKRDGVVPPECRFQVSLPTPLAPISAFVAPDHQAAVEPPYEARMLAELTEIVTAIPPDQLAVQWDTNFEFGMLEGVFKAWFEDLEGGILERLLRLGAHVPAGVQLGYHLCYGDVGHRHFKEPEDAGHLVRVANALAAGLARPLNWVHLPVPRARADPAYFEPMRQLRLHPETELYLGLVHLTDGVEGARERIRAAGAVAPAFGVATECGWGRRAPRSVPALIEIHAELCAPVRARARAQAAFAWPPEVPRIPDEDWTREAVDSFGLKYDTVENHGWYSNLDPTIEQLASVLEDGSLLIDYSGGTGILADRLRLRIFDRQIGILIADSSAKFLRVALERFRDEPRVALRLIRYLRGEKRLQWLDEALEPALLERKADCLVSTNAIHLYTELPGTLRSWARVLRPGGHVLINSGNIRNPNARPTEWILDESVYVIHEVATGLVRTDPRYAAYRHQLDDPERMGRHLEFRDRVFVAPRALETYVGELEGAGFVVRDVSQRTIEADVGEWFDFLGAYSDAVLGWVGGTAKVDGAPAAEAAVRDRLALMRHAMDVLFGGRESFRCCWTYIHCVRP